MNKVLDDLKAEVERTTEVMSSATKLILGIADRVQAAVDKVLENGASAEQLQPVTDEVAALKSSASALADAVSANTPSA